MFSIVASITMSTNEHDKDIRSYDPCLRPYDWDGGGNSHSARRLGSCGLQHRKPLIQTGGRHEREFTVFSWKIGREGREV
jgi:hypothetical protein